MSSEKRKVTKRRATTGEIVEIYPSVEIAAKAEGVAEATIRGWCNGNKKSRVFKFEYRGDSAGGQTSSTLCWHCQNACGHCSWSREFKPVEGWTAVRHDVVVTHATKENVNKKPVESYIVRKCPEFVEDQPKTMALPWMTKKCVECSSFMLCAACGPICKKRR